MATLSDLKARVLEMVGDPDQEGYSDQLLVDAIAAAHDAILQWVPKTATTSLSSGSAVHALPADCYAVEACADGTTGEMFPKAVLIPGHFIGATLSINNNWILYPNGSITFSKDLANDTTLYYLAYWTKPDISSDPETFDIEPPDSTHTGLALYAASYAIYPAAINAGEIRQFGTRVDSGNPEHNPMQESSNWLLKLFTNEMNRHPKYQKAQQ
jgi:hypothetical protein